MCKLGPLAQTIIRWTLVGFVTVTWVFWVTAVSHCSFVRVRGKGDSEDSRRVGLFGWAISVGDDEFYTCAAYTDDQKDDINDAGNAARAFGAIGVTVHSLAFCMVIVYMLWVKTCSRVFWWIARGCFIVSFISGLLTFSAFGIDYCTDEDKFGETECRVGAAGAAAGLNSILMVVVITLSWLVGAPEHPIWRVSLWREEQEEEQPQQEASKALGDEEAAIVAAEAAALPAKVVEDNTAPSTASGGEVVNIRIENTPQGKKTIKEVIHPDGSKTITTTFEEAGAEEEFEEETL